LNVLHRDPLNMQISPPPRYTYSDVHSLSPHTLTWLVTL